VKRTGVTRSKLNSTLLSKPLAEELRLLRESLSLAAKRAAEAARGDVFGSAAESRKAQLADEKLQAIKRRIADIEGCQIK
jgi:hypothetical protein